MSFQAQILDEMLHEGRSSTEVKRSEILFSKTYEYLNTHFGVGNWTDYHFWVIFRAFSFQYEQSLKAFLKKKKKSWENFTGKNIEIQALKYDSIEFYQVGWNMTHIFYVGVTDDGMVMCYSYNITEESYYDHFNNVHRRDSEKSRILEDPFKAYLGHH